MNDKQWTILKIILISLFTILIVSIEFAYREPLFNNSLEIIENFQKSNPKIKDFFIFMSQLGTGATYVALITVILLWFPLNKSFAMMCVFIYAYYFDNLMKILYGNPRPYWIKPSLFLACNGGWGNPSGHSFSSVSFYISYWHLITDFNYFKQSKFGIFLRYLILAFFSTVIILIIISRVYLAAHSINQVLYGGLCGLALYFTIFYVMQLPFLSAENFFKIFNQKFFIILSSVWYAMLLFTCFIVYGLIDNHQELYEKTFNDFCPDINPYRMFNADGLFQMLNLLGIMGSFYGLVFLINLCDKKFPNRCEEINHWYRGGWLNNLYRIGICILFVTPFILTFVVSGKSDLALLMTFKVGLPYFLALFSFFGPCIYVCILLKIANPEIHELFNGNFINKLIENNQNNINVEMKVKNVEKKEVILDESEYKINQVNVINVNDSGKENENRDLSRSNVKMI